MIERRWLESGALGLIIWGWHVKPIVIAEMSPLRLIPVVLLTLALGAYCFVKERQA
jgi:hypothetical protein